MGNLPSYSVIITGGLQNGAELQQVQQSFAELFKITAEKASTIVGTKKILKKDTDYKTAQAYKQRLEKVGLVVALREQLPTPKAIPDMELQPTEEEIQAKQEAEETAKDAAREVYFNCPKCNLKQLKTEQCTGCGVFMHKLKNTSFQNTASLQQEDHSETETEISDFEVNSAQSFNSKALIAAAIAAILGALLWSFIAIQFDYELGVIAWLIGGAVGFAAAAFNSQGKTAGAICGVLTLVAILGGKYIAMEHFKDEILSAFSANIEQADEEMKAVYEQQKTAAETFAALPPGEQPLYQFIAEFHYGENATIEDLTPEEIDYFKQDVQPELEKFATNPPHYEQWLSDSVYGGMEKISSIDLIKESFGFIDVIFLFLGIGTAFRLGSAEEF